MSKQTITKMTIFVGFFVSFFSLVIAFLTGGDLFFIFVQRFFGVFVITSFTTWTALSIINSVIISAAQKSVEELKEELEKESRAKYFNEQKNNEQNLDNENLNVGQNLDYTSSPSPEDQLFTDDLNQDEKIEENPEIFEFEPFKPRRLEADIADKQ